MRVLHFLPVYAPAWQYGGPILSVSRLCEGLVQEGVDVRVITTNAGLPDFPHDQLGIPHSVNGVQVTYYPVDQEGGLIRSRALVQALPQQMEWAELLHLSSIWQPLGMSVQKAAHAASVPVIQTLRGALGPYSWRRGWWKKVPYYLINEKYYLQRASALHCTTNQEAREITWLNLKPTIQLLSNPLDLSQVSCDPFLREKWRQEMGVPPGRTLFLVAGRLHHKKGLDILPSVLRSVIDKPWQILFVGNDDDGTRLRLKREMRRLGLYERCHWMDALPFSDLIGLYNAADWLLLPSRHENFGNVVVEALSCGCGVLVSNHVGCAESLLNCPGAHIAQRRHTEWSQAIKLLMKQARPAKSSESWIKKRYSQEAISAAAIKMYSNLMAND